MSEHYILPSNHQEEQDYEIVTCAFLEHGEQKNIPVRIVQRFTEAPFEGYLYVEIAENPGVFTYSHVNQILQTE